MYSSLHLPKVRKVTTGVKKQFDLIIHNGMLDDHLPPGDVIGPVIRDFYAIKYCTKGCGTIVLNDVSFHIKAGQCYVAMPGDVMVETADTQDPWSHTWVTINGIKASMFFNSMGISAKAPVFPWSSNPEFLNLMKETITVCGDISQLTELKRTAYAYLVFDALFAYFRSQANIATSIIDSYISEAIYYMEINYSNNIKISDIAAHVGLNRSYFFSIFKEQTSFSPQEYLTRLRMSKACELFSFPNATVTSIANSLNYEPSVFFRHFKRIFGISPSEYKKSISEKGR